MRLGADIHPYKVQLNIDVILVLQATEPEDHMTKEERPELYAAKVTHTVVRTRPFGNWRKNMVCYATPDWCESPFLYIKPSTSSLLVANTFKMVTKGTNPS